MTYQENQNRKVFNIDYDHTLTSDPMGTYSEDPPPNPQMVHKVRELYRTGNIIIIWTARWWSNASFLVSWLIKNEVPFHGIFMGKGGSDCYIDDKAQQPGELELF